MAEVVAGLLTSAVVKIAGDKLSSAIAEQTNLALNFKDDLQYMKDTMESMAAVFSDAEQQSVKKETVRLWLKRLKDAALDISDMMDDYQETDQYAKAKFSRMFSCITAARKKMVLANKMKNMREKLERINKERQYFDFTATSATSQDRQLHDERETTSDVKEEWIIGRDTEKKNIIELLSSSHSKDGVMVLPIYGLGGMGKSTVAKLVYNDTQFKQYYDNRVWVYVSQDFDLMKIVKSIISQLQTGGEHNRPDTLQLVQQCLNDLLHGKKILIILDDIWEEDDFKLKQLKDMLDKKGSMVDVIVTTRSKDIADKISTINQPYELKGLEGIICWDIIKRYSRFEDKSNKGELEPIGLVIAEKCGGVALAAQALGYMLRSKDLNGWKEVNNSTIWNEPSGVHNSQHMKVLPSLKLSYEWMRPILRLCFSYCAIFPKGSDIFEDDLVHQWFALDFVKNISEGKEYIKQLLGMSFLQHSNLDSKFHGVRYTMHDLVHDLATSVIGDELTVIDASSEKSSNNAGRWKYCRYAVLKNYDGQTKLSKILPKKIRALHFSSNNKLLGSHACSFSFAKCLRVLDFTGCPGVTLPSSIGQLNQLRYLIALELPNQMFPDSIAKLSKLQYLNLQESDRMSSLPESIGILTRLQYLGLSGCRRMLNLSEESLGGLKSLTHLDMTAFSQITIFPESLGGLKSLTHLYIASCTQLTVLPESLGDLKSLMHLDMSQCFSITVLPESLGGLQSLTHLNMSRCVRITVLPESLGGLQGLMHLDVSECERITVLPESLGGLQSLTHLNISGCTRITILPDSLGRLKSLTHLNMSFYCGISVLPESFGGLQSLTHLYMSQCLNITVIPESLGLLKSLMHLDMSRCPRLTVLPESLGGLQSLTHLNMSRCVRITVLPESLGGLQSLIHLDMSSCEGITILPESLGGLQRLTYLDISRCDGITMLPEALGELQSLTHLNIFLCRGITVLPESLGGLKKLTHLYMSGCFRITVLPESMGELQSLTHLDMSWCDEITALPESLGGLQSLTYLNMSGCKGITVLPESFARLKNLKLIRDW